jgi:hypothetical protein
MNLVDLPTELIIAIADNLRTEAEKSLQLPIAETL